MTRDEIYNTWRNLVLKHTRDGCCNFQGAASELAFIAVAAERERLVKAAMSAAEIAIDKAIELEREACAKVCEKMADNIYSNSHEDSQPMPHAVAKFCAAAIRARKEI